MQSPMTYQRPPQLGLLPVALPVAVSGVGAAVSAVANFVGGVFGGSSDPQKDRERKARIDLAFQLAMAADPRPQTTTSPYSNLGGLTGLEYLQLTATDRNASGSALTYRYAQLKWVEYQARRAAGTVGTGLISVSDLPSQIGVVGSVASNPITLLLLVGGAFLLLRRRR